MPKASFDLIMVPVDLAHTDALSRVLGVTADLAAHYQAQVCYVGVGTSQPSSLAPHPAEYEERLRRFADMQCETHGHVSRSAAFIGHDPRTDVDDVLLRAIEEVGADLVVMATHMPTVIDYVWPSNGGKVAAHSKISVFLVR